MLRLLNKQYRHLTSGEINMLKNIFADSIKYNMVKIYKSRYMPFQNKNTALSPNGNIYFDKQHYKDDFSISSNEYKMWFIHEMTHVWQYQNGYKLIINSIKLFLKGKYKDESVYHYSHHSTIDKFSLLNFEQQATIIEHYFGAKYLKIKKYIDILDYLETMLHNFLKNPKDKNLISSI